MTEHTVCIIWPGAIDSYGYGRFNQQSKWKLAHRLAYEVFVGPIPNGLTIDHLCRNRPCVNVHHLEAVTNKVNVLRGEGCTAMNARKIICAKGHPLEGENLKVKKDGNRECRECRRATYRAYRLREMEASRWIGRR